MSRLLIAFCIVLNYSPGKCSLPKDAPDWCTAYMYDPEGILATVPSVLTTVLGVHYGRVLKVSQICVTLKCIFRKITKVDDPTFSPYL